MTAAEMLLQQQAVIAHLTATILSGTMPQWADLDDRELTAAHALAVRIYNISGPNRWTGSAG